MYLINFADTPPTTVFAATSFVTTAPAPTTTLLLNGHPLQNGRVGTYPDIFPENDRGGKGMPARFGRQSVVERGKHHIVSDLAAVPDEDAAVVTKMAAGIDENI